MTDQINATDRTAPTGQTATTGQTDTTDLVATRLRTLARINSGLLTLLVMAVLYFARALIFPITLAVLFKVLLNPLVRTGQRVGVRPAVGAAVVVVELLTITIAVFYIFITPASGWLNMLPQSVRKIEQRIGFLREPFEQIEEANKKIQEAAGGGGPPVTTVRIKPPSMSGYLLNATGGMLSHTFAVFILLYFLLAAGDAFLVKTVEVLPTITEKKKAVEIMRGVEAGVCRYLMCVTIINVGLGIVMGMAMYLIGLPNPFLWGFMAAVLNYIPFLGPLIGAAILLLVSLLTFNTDFMIILPSLIYLLLNSFEGYVITPLFIGAHLDLNPVMIMLWLMVWGWIWGAGGAVLAVPLLAAAKIFCDHVEGLQPLGRFFVR